MTYTMLINGGHNIVIEESATPEQMESKIKGYQAQNQWVKFITPDGDTWLNSHHIVGYRPHGGGAIAMGEPT